MGSDFTSSLRPAIVMTILFALLLGFAYPLLVLGVGQGLFSSQANGSLVRDGDRIVGSTVIGQAFTSDRYFQTRPSAAGKGYDGLSSSGSNYGPTSRALVDRVEGDLARARDAGIGGPVPADLVTASGSGLDPDLSPAAALAQVARVARARRLSEAEVRALVNRAVAPPLLGFLGEERVNVFALNRQLDALGAKPGR
ncbi:MULTISPECIES: potassium-transporting ATPase subunit KdpC [unclassified Sphingomonas]|uniref:potassium-transporting ATPase subunit KdpC n=1 Tax=unclassified Sphingomonas TaxID=196159 RepID=UPI0006FDB634|nr:MULTISPECIES: potassium-transporting ATPase subunit KdpC [unclassified Sphingomonas]KQX20882.1 ATPase [Sphingomonas sp. Root1294]KQY68728.1 ATPase [Sphingomonas sp. Root50]KRB88134.1 ATPase [Sphingomonas sp. Root720]